METASPRREAELPATAAGATAASRGGAARPQLTAEELQQLKWLLGGGLTLLSLGTVFYLDVDAWTVMALAAVGVTSALVWPAWPARIPRWGHRLAFPLIAAGFAGDLWLTGEVLPAMVRLDILLLLYRGITYREKRDDLQVIVLGLFLVVVAGVLSVSLTFAVQILAFTAGALVFLLVITLAETEGEKAGRAGDTPWRSAPPLSRGDSGQVPVWARRVEWRRLPGRVRAATDWRVVALAGGLFAGLVALSALLFLAIPRFQLENSLFLERFVTKKARTGFSDTIRFGEVTEITQDTGVAVSVDVSDRGVVPARPYWRMLVLDEYRDGTFRVSPVLRRMTFAPERSGTTLRMPGPRRGRGEPVFWTFYLESGVSRYLPLLGGFDVLQFREPQHFRVAPALGVVALRDEPVTMTAYRVEGMETGETTRDPAFAVRLRERGANPRAAAALLLGVGVDEAGRTVLDGVVREIKGGDGETGSGGGVKRGSTFARAPADKGGAAPPGGELAAGEFARRAAAWLGRRHAYSLQPHVPAGAGDPLVRWLASGEGGHCELFAGSLVLLARAAGVPARVVIGFRGGSWNGYSNNFTLRNADAHAWCEVFEAQAGAWVRVDPTPGAGAGADEKPGEASLARRLDRSWTARLDSLRVFWYRRIVNFDQRSQVETLKAAKEAAEDSGRRLREAVRRAMGAVRDWLGAPWTGGRAAVVLALVAVGAGAVGAGWAGWKFRFWIFDFRFRRGSGRGDTVRREAGRWLGRLRAARAGKGEGCEKKDEPAVLMELQRLRYGARETWPEVGGIFRRARQAWRATRRARMDPRIPKRTGG